MEDDLHNMQASITYRIMYLYLYTYTDYNLNIFQLNYTWRILYRGWTLNFCIFSSVFIQMLDSLI